MTKVLRNYGLGIALGALFLSSWIAQALVQVPGEGWRQFWIATLENWQSEFLQLLTFVVLTKFLFFKGSHEAKDPPDATPPRRPSTQPQGHQRQHPHPKRRR